MLLTITLLYCSNYEIEILLIVRCFCLSGVAEIILKTQMKLSLKCMAANAVKHHKLTYQGQVPQALESFIELHGPGIVKKA